MKILAVDCVKDTAPKTLPNVPPAEIEIEQLAEAVQPAVGPKAIPVMKPNENDMAETSDHVTPLSDDTINGCVFCEFNAPEIHLPYPYETHAQCFVVPGVARIVQLIPSVDVAAWLLGLVEVSTEVITKIPFA